MITRRQMLTSTACGATVLTSPFANFTAEAMSSDDRPVLFDSHAHLVADDVVRYPRIPRSPPAGHIAPPGVYGRPGGKAGPNPIHEVPEAGRMIRWMAEQNVAGMIAVQKGLTYGYDNSYILDVARDHPKLMSALVIMDSLAPETPATIEHLVRTKAISGVRFFGGPDADGDLPWLSSPAAMKCWDVVKETGIVLDIEVIAPGGGGPTLPVVAKLAHAFPQVRIVLDHLFNPAFEHRDDFGLSGNYALIRECPNVFFKFTTINLDLIREANVDARMALRIVVDILGSNRVMWGSDIGTSSGSYAEMVARILDASALLSAQERHDILYGVGCKVFRAAAGSVKLHTS